MQEDVEFARTRAAKLRLFLASKGIDIKVGDSFEAISVLEGAADWNTHRAALAAAPASQELFCPYCGHRGKVSSIGSAFVEQGPSVKDGYMFEGDAEQLRCSACNGQFVNWDGGGELYLRRHELLLLAVPGDAGARAYAFEALHIAQVHGAFEWADLTTFLEGHTAESFVSYLRDNTFLGWGEQFFVTAGTAEEALVLARKQTKEPVFHVLS